MKIRFEIQAVILTAIAYAFGIFGWPVLFHEATPSFWLWVPGFLFVLFLLVFRFTKAGLKKRPAQFITHFMGGTTIKMLLSVAVVGVYAYNFPETKMKFAISFMSLYVSYLLIDVIALLKESAKTQEKASN